jgi:hypothetical protein
MEIRDAMRGIRIDLDSEQQLQCEILFRDLERLTAEDADLESLGYRIGAALGRNGWYLRDSPRSEYVPGPDHPGVRQQLLIDAQLPVVPSSVPPRPELPDQQMGLPHERKSPFDPIAGGRIRHSLPATDPESPTSTVFIVDSAALDAALSADSNSAQPIQALNGVRMPSATITNPWLVNSGYDGAFITFSKPSGQKQLFLLRRSEGAGARLGTMVGNEDAAKLQEKPNIFSRWPDGFRIDKEMGALGTPTDIVFFQSTDYQMLDPDALAQAVAQELIIGVPQEMKYAAIDRGYDGPAGRDPLRLD